MAVLTVHNHYWTYKALVWPCMEHGSRSPHIAKNINLLKSVQCRAARWIKSKNDSILYQWSKRTDDCLKELKWPTLTSWRIYQSVVMLHSILNNWTINFYRHFDFNMNATQSHALTLQTWSSINAFRYFIFHERTVCMELNFIRKKKIVIITKLFQITAPISCI